MLTEIFLFTVTLQMANTISSEVETVEFPSYQTCIEYQIKFDKNNIYKSILGKDIVWPDERKNDGSEILSKIDKVNTLCSDTGLKGDL